MMSDVCRSQWDLQQLRDVSFIIIIIIGIFYSLDIILSIESAEFYCRGDYDDVRPSVTVGFAYSQSLYHNIRFTCLGFILYRHLF